MADIKIYFILLNDIDDIEISVHRDLNTIQLFWDKIKNEKTVGLIHIGFVRPKIEKTSNLLKFRGQLLVTVSAKWALPSDYNASQAVVGEVSFSDADIPIYLLLKGFGYQISEFVFEPYTVDVTSVETGVTLIDAALDILNSSRKPLSKEEIFASICEKNLYVFKGSQPLTALGNQLLLSSQSIEASNSSNAPVLGATPEGKYFSLTNRTYELKGWLAALSLYDNDTSTHLSSYGIFDDETYFNLIEKIPRDLRDRVDLFRYRHEKDFTDIQDLSCLIKILPTSILMARLADLTLPARVKNCLMAQNISCIAQLKNVPMIELLQWPNFGKKSSNDLCSSLISHAENNSFFHFKDDIFLSEDEPIRTSKDINIIHEEGLSFEIISKTPLKKHFELALSNLDDNQKQVIEHRTGLYGEVKTLEEVGKIIGVTRERIRQIQKKYVDRIIKNEFWDDVIAIKIGKLLSDRASPLYLEMLELEDSWFKGFMGNYQHLGAIIELFSDNEIRIIKISGANIVTRIKQDDWNNCINQFRDWLKECASDGGWSRSDIDLTFKAALLDKGASELILMVWAEFADALQFNGEKDDSVLLAFGRSAESAVSSVLQQAEKPLHYSEISVRASEVLGRRVDERRAQGALQGQGALLYGRGIYGLEKHNTISERMSSNIRLVVTKMLYDGPLMKQWHSAVILDQLRSQFTALPEELDNYLLSIILSKSDRLIYLNRMVWARLDSGQTADDRIDMAEAFITILEKNGGPLKGKLLKERLSEDRGVPDGLQIQAKDRLIQIGPDTWGLLDRDIFGTEIENQQRLDIIFDYLKKADQGIHISEVDDVLNGHTFDHAAPTAYMLLNLAQRDERFYLARSMFLGLAEWGGDVRRLNVTQAVRKILDETTIPLTTFEVNAKVEELTKLSVDGTVTGILINEGGIYDPLLKVWKSKK